MNTMFNKAMLTNSSIFLDADGYYHITSKTKARVYSNGFVHWVFEFCTFLIIHFAFETLKESSNEFQNLEPSHDLQILLCN